MSPVFSSVAQLRRFERLEEKMSSLAGKTVFISGASRGIGLAIGLRAAKDGANVVVTGKTATPHPRLPGTVYEAAAAIEAAGGKALPIILDIRFEDQVFAAVERATRRFGGIDILVNNASAISLTGTLETRMKVFDLMMDVNLRGTFMCSQACLPHLAKATNPHILTLSPPLDMRAKWFAVYPAYTIAKYGMSMCALGMAEEFRSKGIAVNALWPRTIIATAALQIIPGADPGQGRKPEIVADAAWYILTRDSRTTTGNFFIDEDVLAAEGITDLSGYAVAPSTPLQSDLFLD
jgi:citronellol/citronellal dehydrogenase